MVQGGGDNFLLYAKIKKTWENERVAHYTTIPCKATEVEGRYC
jgi:hypothetical protein